MATYRPVLRTRRTTLFDNCFHRIRNGIRGTASAGLVSGQTLYAGLRIALTAVWTRALEGSRGASTDDWPPVDPGAGRSPGRLEPGS